MATRLIFCANEQSDTEHELSKSSFSGDLIAECRSCGRTLKFPGSVTNSQFDKLLSAHKEANTGQQVVVPGSVGPPDVHVAPGNPPIGATQEQMDAIEAAEGSGPRAQDNLTDAERATWEQTNNAT